MISWLQSNQNNTPKMQEIDMKHNRIFQMRTFCFAMTFTSNNKIERQLQLWSVWGHLGLTT